MTDRTEILDEDFKQDLSVLSDFQLAGILAEKVKYPPLIFQRVELELRRRNIAADELQQLKHQYWSVPPINRQATAFYHWPSLGFLLLLALFSASLVKVIFSWVVIIASIITIQRKAF